MNFLKVHHELRKSIMFLNPKKSYHRITIILKRWEKLYNLCKLISINKFRFQNFKISGGTNNAFYPVNKAKRQFIHNQICVRKLCGLRLGFVF